MKRQSSLRCSVPQVSIFASLSAHLDRLWTLWELMLLNEPLMVVAPSPSECSAAVAALVALVAPLPYAGDFRPYFTIHDRAFAGMAAGRLPDPARGAGEGVAPLPAAAGTGAAPAPALAAAAGGAAATVTSPAAAADTGGVNGASNGGSTSGAEAEESSSSSGATAGGVAQDAAGNAEAAPPLPDWAVAAAAQAAQAAAEPPPHVLGITNLFFVKTLATWPHVLSVGDKPPPAVGGPRGGAGGMGAGNGRPLSATARPGMIAKAVQAFRQRRQGAMQVKRAMPRLI